MCAQFVFQLGQIKTKNEHSKGTMYDLIFTKLFCQNDCDYNIWEKFEHGLSSGKTRSLGQTKVQLSLRLLYYRF